MVLASLGSESVHILASSGLFNVVHPIDELSILRIPRQPIKIELIQFPTIEERWKATEHLKPCKAARVDGIPPEIWGHGGPAILEKLLKNKRAVSQDIKNYCCVLSAYILGCIPAVMPARFR